MLSPPALNLLEPVYKQKPPCFEIKIEMLNSIIKIEEYLKCSICSSTLTQTRTVTECGHRFCLNCVSEVLGTTSKCPQCQLPALIKNLRKDPMFDNLTRYIRELKSANLSQTLTPLDLSLKKRNLFTVSDTNASASININDKEKQGDYDSILPELASDFHHNTKRKASTLDNTTAIQDNYSSDDNNEDEYHDDNIQIPSKKMKPDDGSDDDTLDSLIDVSLPMLTDLFSLNSQPKPTISKPNNKNESAVAEPISSEDADELMSTEPASVADVSEPMSANDIDELMSTGNSSQPMTTVEDTELRTENLSTKAEEVTPASQDSEKQDSKADDTEHGQTTANPHSDAETDPDQVSPVVMIPPVNTYKKNKKKGPIWQCPECTYGNEGFMQACGICHVYRKQDIPVLETQQLSETPPTLNATTTPKNVASDKSHELTAMDNNSTEAEASTNNNSFNATIILPNRTRNSAEKKKDIHILYTGIMPEDEKLLDKVQNDVVMSKLKFSLHTQMRDFDEVTHIITSIDKKKVCKRTLKYLQGLLTGKWIVEPNWLIKSIKEKQWQLENTYEIQGDTASGMTRAPYQGRDRVMNKDDPLFQDIRFYFLGEFTGKHNKHDLLVLCRAGGGKVINRKPTGQSRFNQTDLIDPKEPIVIVCDSKKKNPPWLKYCQVRNPTWIIECISKLKIV